MNKPTRDTAASPVYYVLLFVALAVYFAFACFRLRAIPLGYDELLFCNAALGSIDPDLFNFIKIGRVPILLMDYIGALKAWLYYPVFKVFGVSVWSIRLPMVVLTMGGMVWLAEFVRREWGWLVALLILFFLAFDASFVHYTRFDTGPNAIELFLKIATVGLWLRFVRTGRVRYVVWICVSMLLGLFNKLNFVWYINAFYAGLIVAYGRWGFLWSRKNARPIGQGAKLLIGTYVVAVAYLAFANTVFDVLEQKVGDETGVVQPLARVFSLFGDVMVGSGLMVHNYWMGFGSWPQWLFDVQPIVAAILLGTSAVVAGTLLFRARLVGPIPNKHRLFVFSTVVLYVMLGQMALTERARYGWHIFAVYPFATMSGAYALWSLWLLMPGPLVVRKAVARFVVVSLFGLVVAAHYSMFLALRYQKIQHGAAINNLIDYARPINKKFVIVGGACTTQLLTMTQQPDKYYELTYLFSITHKFLTIRAKDHKEFVQKYLAKPGEYLFIDSLHPMKPGQVAQFRDFYCRPFLDVVAEHGKQVEVVKEILGPQDGYRIYQLQ